jgi:hypothetical protein
LIAAAEAEAVDPKTLDKEVKERADSPSRVDPGLTAVWLVLGGAIDARTEGELKENIELRHRYNAARIKIGMTQSEVERILGRESLESGEFDSGSYKLYGSAKTFDIPKPLHFTNVLVLYQDGTVQGIFSSGWVQGLSTGAARISDGAILWK